MPATFARTTASCGSAVASGQRERVEPACDRREPTARPVRLRVRRHELARSRDVAARDRVLDRRLDVAVLLRATPTRARAGAAARSGRRRGARARASRRRGGGSGTRARPRRAATRKRFAPAISVEQRRRGRDLEHGVAEVGREPVEHRRPQEEAPDLRRRRGEHVVGEEVEDVARVPRELLDEAGADRAAPSRRGARGRCRRASLRHGRSRARRPSRPRSTSARRKRSRASSVEIRSAVSRISDELAVRAQPCDGQTRDPRGSRRRPAPRPGTCSTKLRHGRVAQRASVRGASRRGSRRAPERRRARARGAARAVSPIARRPADERVERRLAGGRVHLSQPAHEVRPQPGGIGVGRLQRHPDERRPLAIGLDPLREQGRFPVARRARRRG